MSTSVQPDNPVGSKNTTVSAVGEKDTPSVPHPTYSRLKKRWEKCRAFMGETEEIRLGRETYLPRFAAEGNESYEFRLTLVAVSNFFKRAVHASVGMLLEKEPELGDDMPEKLVAFAEDITLSGKHISVYAKELTIDHVVDGCVGTLVDFPRADDPKIDRSGASLAATVALETKAQLDSADEAKLGLRPFFVKYTRSEILKIVKGKVNGVKVNILVVLREATEKLDGNFAIKDVVQYRVFRRTTAGVTWELWEDKEDTTGTDNIIAATPLLIGGKQARAIPFSLFGEFDALPPLENLADLNIEHHNSKTNIRNLEFLAMVPTQVRVGAEPDIDPKTGAKTYPPITLGPRSTIEAPFKEGLQQPLYWHSPDVSVLEPGNKSLEDIKADMGTAALNFLAPDKRVAETEASKKLDSKSQNASLSMVGRGLQDHLEECFGFAGEMVNEPGGSVTIDMEFEDSPLTPEEMSAYLDAAIQGRISQETFLDAWKRGKRLDESLDVVKERRRILLENALPPEPNPAGGVE